MAGVVALAFMETGSSTCIPLKESTPVERGGCSFDL